MNRLDLHRLVDALPDDRVGEVGRRLAEEYRLLVERALGDPGEPGAGERDLDAELEQNPGLRDQLERSLSELKRGELGVPHEVVRRRYRGE